MVDDSSKRITQAELARHLNVSRAAVHKAVKAGRITPGADGLFDIEQAREDWQNNTRSAVAAAQRSAAGPKRERGGQPKYASARARKEHHLANMAAIKEQELLGRLLAREDAEFAFRHIGTTLRAGLEQMGTRLAPLLYGHGVAQMANVIDEAMRQFLEDFGIEVQASMRKLADDAAQKNRA